jgi:two-component system cell cycle response regulator
MSQKKSQFPILIAEDDPVSRRMLGKVLNKSGYEVVAVENGKIALDKYKEKFFPIVLTDWMMPEMDGFELCKSIRDHAIERYVFIVLLTAKDSKEDIILGFEAGADDYLTKPINYAELIARIKTGTRILELEQSLRIANEEIKKLSITDALTTVYNHRYIMENLPREIKRSVRYSRNLSLVMVDIDHFKKINDTYGHQTGDYVLKKISSYLKDSIRYELDWVARYGGEEFLIVLPETDISGSTCVAERFRETIEKMEIKFKGKHVSITASFGVSSFEPSDNSQMVTAEMMIKDADKFLYEAKNGGRNKVVSGVLKIS